MARKKYTVPDQKSATYGIPAETIAMICEVSFRTACRWKSGLTKMPPAARMLLCGDLGCIDLRWAGWMVRQDRLVSPEGWEITVGDVLALPLLRQQLAAYQTEFRKRLAIHEQPLPNEFPEWIWDMQA